MMKLLNEFRLVDGVYDLQEVKEIMFNLIDDKIKFHQLKAFSDNIRLGEIVNEHSNLRLNDLKSSKNDLIQLLESLSNTDSSEGKKFKIYSEVKIELI